MLVFVKDFVFARNKSFLCVRLPLAVLPYNWEQFTAVKILVQSLEIILIKLTRKIEM